MKAANENTKSRSHPAHHAIHEQGNRSLIIFVTVCTKNRKSILAHHDIHQLLLESWQAADHWLVGRYMVMPDHIHLFCSPGIPEYPEIKRWIQHWKSYASQRWPRRHEQSIWQADFWDRQLRRSESYTDKWIYVENNPVRHGLVENASAWPYQGETNTLFWHDE